MYLNFDSSLADYSKYIISSLGPRLITVADFNSQAPSDTTRMSSAFFLSFLEQPARAPGCITLAIRYTSVRAARDFWQVGYIENSDYVE